MFASWAAMAVNLLFNRQPKQIAIGLANPQHPMSFPLVSDGAPAGRRIMASNFCNHYGISFGHTHSFVRPEIIEGRLLLRLDETIVIRRQYRPRRKQKV
jgi:hypothetical protein